MSWCAAHRQRGHTEQQDLYLITECYPLKISTPLRTQTRLDTVDRCIVNPPNKMQDPTDNNPFNAKLNPICPLLPLFGAHHILHVSR